MKTLLVVLTSLTLGACHIRVHAFEATMVEGGGFSDAYSYNQRTHNRDAVPDWVPNDAHIVETDCGFSQSCSYGYANTGRPVVIKHRSGNLDGSASWEKQY